MAIHLGNNKSYDRKVYTVPAESVYTIDFNGMTANYFRVNNMSDVTLYCATQNIPTKELFDFKANPKAVANFCEPAERNKIYIYNDTKSDAKIILTSWADDFDATFMAVSEITLNNEGVIETDGIIKGWKTSLPAGNNNIGSVEVSNLSSIITNVGQMSNEIMMIANWLHEYKDGYYISIPQQIKDYLELINTNIPMGSIADIWDKVSIITTCMTEMYGNLFTNKFVSDPSIFELLKEIKEIVSTSNKSAAGDTIFRTIIAVPLGGSIYDYTFDLNTQYPGFTLEKFITVCGSTQGDTVKQVFYYIDSFDIKNQVPAQQCLPITTFNDIAENKGKTKLNIQCDELSKNDYAIFQIAYKLPDDAIKIENGVKLKEGTYKVCLIKEIESGKVHTTIPTDYILYGAWGTDEDNLTSYNFSTDYPTITVTGNEILMGFNNMSTALDYTGIDIETYIVKV